MTYSKINIKGFTLLETLVYTAGAVLFITVIFTLLVYIFRWNESVATPARVDRVGINITNKIMSDIRAGVNINFLDSLFDDPNGSIAINILNGTSTLQKKYFLQDGRILYQVGSSSAEFLSPKEVTVNSMEFKNFTSPQSKAVRFSISIPYSTRDTNATSTFSGFSVMKNSYE